jgi:hypothetical protein
LEERDWDLVGSPPPAALPLFDFPADLPDIVVGGWWWWVVVKVVPLEGRGRAGLVVVRARAGLTVHARHALLK